jgi:hypothetical protein
MLTKNHKTKNQQNAARGVRSIVSQEIVAGTPTPGRDVSLIVGNGREDAEFGVEGLVHRHDGCDIAAAVAVVWCGPDCHYRLLCEVEL